MRIDWDESVMTCLIAVMSTLAGAFVAALLYGAVTAAVANAPDAPSERVTCEPGDPLMVLRLHDHTYWVRRDRVSVLRVEHEGALGRDARLQVDHWAIRIRPFDELLVGSILRCVREDGR